MIEKPLHVQVAEALGWTENEEGYGDWWRGVPPWSATRHEEEVPRYDTDWSATGPLIEKYEITLGPTPGRRTGEPPWVACSGLEELAEVEEGADAPLIAVCHLILALHKAGKLNVAV